MNTSMKEFVCPSNGNQLYQNPQANPPQSALTNYKAMGASCKTSLAMCANTAGTAPYGTSTIHPDGAIYPSRQQYPACRILDGLSHTIMIMETMDDTNSRWMVGAECVLTGLPVPRPVRHGARRRRPPYNYFTPAKLRQHVGRFLGGKRPPVCRPS